MKVFFYLNHLRRLGGLEEYDFEHFGQDSRFQEYIQGIEWKQIQDCKERFIESEYNLLKYIGFDADIQVPYKYLTLFEASEYFQSSTLAETQFIEISKRFVNDSLLTTMCLYFEPYVIALAAMNMSSVYLERELEEVEPGVQWFQVLERPLEQEYLSQAVGELKKVYQEEEL